MSRPRKSTPKHPPPSTTRTSRGLRARSTRGAARDGRTSRAAARPRSGDAATAATRAAPAGGREHDRNSGAAPRARLAASEAATGQPAAPTAPATRDTRAFPQRRAQETHRRLLDAAAEVFAERGYDETQTPDIAERAGVAVGTFYRYFSDKRQAFIELVTEYLEGAYQNVMKNLTLEVFSTTRTPRDRRAAVDHVIDVLFRNTSDSPRLHRVFMAVAMRDDAVARIRDEFEERGRAALAELLERVTSRSRIPDVVAAAHVIQVAAQDLAFVTAGLRGQPPTATEIRALRAALASMLYRYVFGDD